MEHLDSDDRNKLFSILPEDVASDVLPEVEDVLMEDILEELDTSKIAKLVDEMDSDDATDLLNELPTDKVNEVLSKVDEEHSEEIQELLHYPEDSAGGIMAKEYVAVNANCTVQEAIEELRRNHDEDEITDIYTCYVVDDFETLVGLVNLVTLVLADPAMLLRDIMNEEVFAVDSTIDQEEVAQIFRKIQPCFSPGCQFAP